MIQRLKEWTLGRQSRPALLMRAMLGVTEPGDAELTRRLAIELGAAPTGPGLAAAAWRLIELMDVGPAPADRVAALLSLLENSPAPPLPLTLPTGALITDATSAALAGEALALRALTKARRQNDHPVRARLDDLARRGPDMEGVTRRASALHGLAADAVHYPMAVTKLTAELLRVQHADGRWIDADLFHVGQALLSVEDADAQRALRRGAEALGKEQRKDGGFGSEERSWIACRWLLRAARR